MYIIEYWLICVGKGCGELPVQLNHLLRAATSLTQGQPTFYFPKTGLQDKIFLLGPEMGTNLFYVAFNHLWAGECWSQVNFLPRNSQNFPWGDIGRLCHSPLQDMCGVQSLKTQDKRSRGRRKGDFGLPPDSQTWLYVLVSTRPWAWAEADPLLIWWSPHWQRRSLQWIQHLQIKQGRFSPHCGVSYFLSDNCVLLCHSSFSTALQGCLLSAHKVSLKRLTLSVLILWSLCLHKSTEPL